MAKFFPLAVIALCLAFHSAMPVAAAPMSVSASTAQSAGNPVELVREQRRQSRRARGVGIFIIPGFYWGPAWWDENYTRACWKEIQPCKNCARNWAYSC